MKKTKGHWVLVAVALATGCADAGGAGQKAAGRAVLSREVPWAGQGVWIRMDTHVHTRFSDGGFTPDQVAARAVEFGCDAIAITDHLDRKLKAATPEYAAAIAKVRDTYPSLVVVAGGEWNIPPWGGDEHATLLVPPGPREIEILAEFKPRFDDLGRPTHEAGLADEALRWLAANGVQDGLAPVVIYNHPSRKDAKSMENVPDLVRWRGVNDLVIGMEGAPGHQGARALGSYTYSETPIDRWDPATARVGDAWDTLLARGLDVHAAIAGSDFHNVKSLGDRWPCEFAETWLYAPERSISGVLRALRAGAFFGVHGHIAREVLLTAVVPGLRPVVTGETLQVPSGTSVSVRVALKIPERDWKGEASQIDAIELIAVTAGGARVVAARPPDAGEFALVESITVPKGGIVVRARGRRVVADGPDLMFHTNAIRIVGR